MTHFQIECIESKTKNIRQHYGRFIIEPLEQGQGITVGNALRRTTLSNLQGTAIVAARIAGINHEFSTVAGIREDVLEILLNLKKIVLQSYTNKPQIGKLCIQGPAIITAGMIEVPTEIRIVDPKQYITTICSNTIMEMELHIENGKGYKLTDKTDKNIAIDFLNIDAVFMPVKRFNYTVEEIQISPKVAQDRLILELCTDGSITPQEALNQGAIVLTNLFYPLRKINFKPVESPEINEQKKINQVPIEELQLSVRAYNCLKRAHMHTMSDLLEYSQEELMEIKNFGKKSAEEVIDALQKRLGISLTKEKIHKA